MPTVDDHPRSPLRDELGGQPPASGGLEHPGANTGATEAPGPSGPQASAGGHRRLTARSVIASTLLGVSPPALPTRSLVGTAELLGIAPGTARVAMARMGSAGELEAIDDGYRLVGPALLARQARQDLSRHGADLPWDATWHTCVVISDARPAVERTALRSAMTALRLAELREGVWLRPANLPVGLLHEAEAIAADQCLVLTSTVADPAALAASLWDLDGWARIATYLLADIDRLGGRLARTDHTALADGFVVSAAVLRHLQADPLLPAELLTERWPGRELRHRHRAFDHTFKEVLAAWQRRHHRSP
ncbi:PaaX family transcriptional regulator C-terminal domain-containing protein [soil metagenome]